MRVFLIYFMFGLFRVLKSHIWEGNRNTNMQNKQVCSDFIQSEWSEDSRNASVWLHTGKQRPHILRGHKGYINQPCDEVNKLISVLFPGEERGFCWSATMTPLWLILPNANDWLDWRTSIVLLDSSLVTAFGSGKCGVRSPLLVSGTPCFVGKPAQNKMGQTRTHVFMQASQNTPILLEFCLMRRLKSLFHSNSLCPARTSCISNCICAKSFSICSKIEKVINFHTQSSKLWLSLCLSLIWA